MWWVCACVLVGLSPASADPPPGLPSSPANGNTPMWNATWTDLLKHDLLMKYDKFARPAQHTNVTEVEFALTYKHIDVDEARSVMTLNAYSKMHWIDEKLKWNESDYGGLKLIQVADHEVWQPDIALYNSAVGGSIDHYGNVLCQVRSSGEVIWVPPSQFSTYCDINLRKWPYDQQTCHFVFGSWVFDGEQVRLKSWKTTNSTGADLEDLMPMQWTVLSVVELEHCKYYDCCPEPWYTIEVVIIVERKSPAFGAVVFTPALVCVVLTLAVFWLPPHASEKFLLAGVTALIDCMLLLYFAQRLPLMGQHIPLIVEFYGYSLVLVCLSVVTSVVTVNLSRRPLARPVPWVVSRVLARYAVLLGIPNNKSTFASMYNRQDCEELHERNLVDRGRTESVDTTITVPPSFAQSTHEWALLASALDRLMFILYVIIFLLLAAAFFIS